MTHSRGLLLEWRTIASACGVAAVPTELYDAWNGFCLAIKVKLTGRHYNSVAQYVAFCLRPPAGP